VRAGYQGSDIVIGNPGLMSELGIEMSAEAKQHLNGLKRDGKTSVLVAYDGSVIGVLGIADTLREESRQMVEGLRKAGLEKIVMLTGDDRVTAEAIASQAGIHEVRAELMPEDKLEAIRALQAEGHVGGDGWRWHQRCAGAGGGRYGIAMGAPVPTWRSRQRISP
jgi:Cd2+/Zn2+-exporting ATPase